MEPTTVLLTTLIAFNLLLLAIGFLAERRTKDEGDFLLGGRGLGPWVSAISASASSSSVWTLLGVSGYAYLHGLSAVWLFPACVGGFALNWFVVAPRLRAMTARTGAMTVTELLAGPARGPAFQRVRVFASVVLLLSLTVYVAAQFKGAGTTFATQCGFGERKSMAIGAAIIVAYTLLGGFWAVSLTDTVQGLMMAASAVAIPLAALLAVGGPAELIDGISNLPPAFSSLLPSAESTPDSILKILVLLAIGLGYPGQPHVVNRFMAMGDRTSMRSAKTIAMTWAVVVYTGMIVLGWCGRVLHQSVLADNETLFFTLTSELFPVMVAALMTAAVLSAIMSTADSQLLVAGSSVSHDLMRGGRSPKSALRVSRLVVLLVSVAAVGLSLFGAGDDDPSSLTGKIFASVLIAWTAIGAAFGPLLLVTLWRGPVGANRSLAAMIAGFGCTAVAYGFESTRGTVVERLLPYVLSFVVLLLWAKPPATKS